MSALLNLGIVIRFLLAGMIGAGGALGVAAVTAPPQSNLLPASQTYNLTADTGDQPVQFGLTAIPDKPPVVLQALPADKQIVLVAYSDTPAPDTGGNTNIRPNWLSAVGFPRVVPITQFDGGPLGNANCTMASGAMLARLGFGIVTTGSQLRALQPDQEGGTSIADLEVAIEKFGVSFSRAAVTPLQLRALLYAGAGAVVQGNYGDIPVELRLQKDFTGGHAIYLDGFRPASADGPAAYYVLDPLGPVWRGYKGGWWPADLVEKFGLDFGGGAIYTAWAFPGGHTPLTYPQLPPEAFPSASLEPGATPTPVPSAAASAPPLPSPDPSASVPPAGDSPAPNPSGWWKFPDVPISAGGLNLAFLTACAGSSPPSWCPGGVIAVFPPDSDPVPTLPPLAQTVKITLLYANAISPGTMQVIFEAPPGSVPALQFWDQNATGGSIGVAPLVQTGLLDGKVVQIAQFPIEQGGAYNFVASAAGTGFAGLSDVGTAGP